MPPKEQLAKLGEALGRIRRRKGLTQRTVAENIGADFGDISRWENGRDMYVSTLLRYLNGLDENLSGLAREMGQVPTQEELKQILLSLRDEVREAMQRYPSVGGEEPSSSR
jgi:transcriptional regulator with XRE-family HTH domain